VGLLKQFGETEKKTLDFGGAIDNTLENNIRALTQTFITQIESQK